MSYGAQRELRTLVGRGRLTLATGDRAIARGKMELRFGAERDIEGLAGMTDAPGTNAFLVARGA